VPTSAQPDGARGLQRRRSRGKPTTTASTPCIAHEPPPAPSKNVPADRYPGLGRYVSARACPHSPSGIEGVILQGRIASRLGALALVAILTTFPAAARAQPPAEAGGTPLFSLSGEVDVNSHYVWHGISLSSGAVINPSLTLAYGKWSLNAWTNLDRDLHRQHALSEVDLTLGWSTTLLGLELAPSALYYHYPAVDLPNTAEVQLQVGRTLAGPFSAFTRQTIEVMAVRGAAWSSGGIGCDLPEWKHVAFSGNAQYGRGWWKFASAYADPALEGLNLASVGLSATVTPPGTGFTLRPHVDWFGVGNARVRDSLTGSTPWVVGVALGGSF
jgi:hypothetical protein